VNVFIYTHFYYQNKKLQEEEYKNKKTDVEQKGYSPLEENQ